LRKAGARKPSSLLNHVKTIEERYLSSSNNFLNTKHITNIEKIVELLDACTLGLTKVFYALIQLLM